MFRNSKILVVVPGLGLLCLFILFSWWRSSPITFDSYAWRHARLVHDTRTTLRMRESLLGKIRGGRLTEEELYQLLGMPDQSTGHGVVSYKLGPQKIFLFDSVDDLWITIYILDNHMVDSAFIRPD